MTPLDTALTLGAATRLTQATTQDLIGQWTIRDPTHRWAHWDGTTEPRGWRQKLAAGTDCPHCVAMWTTTLLVATHRIPRLRPAWRTLTLTLTLAWAAGHLTAHLGD